jgi:predicted RND superfamily exporter protein
VLVAFATSSISLVALIGLFAIFGIAARNSILQINHYQHLERYEGEQFGLGLVLRGARERFAPILITALATGLALVPLAISGNTPGLEVERPMAIIIIGGLVTATLFNLFIVPALYSGFGTAYVRPKVDEPVLSPLLSDEMTKAPHNGDAAVSSHNGDSPNPSHNGDSAVSSHNGDAHISSHNGDSAVSSHNDDSSVSS